MITISGQLAIKTIHGRNGDFNVGKLATSIGEFSVKNPELEQYKEGKYDGEFIITEIYPKSYIAYGRAVVEIRAHLGGITLSNIDALSKDEARQLTPQEIDPAEEETPAQKPAVADPAPATTALAPIDPKLDTTPFPFGEMAVSTDKSEEQQKADAELFGTVWPLAGVVKLDATVDRRLLRKQRDRLNALGYEFQPLSQDWHLAA